MAAVEVRWVDLISRGVGKPPGSVFTVLKYRGGIASLSCKERVGGLAVGEREKVSPQAVRRRFLPCDCRSCGACRVHGQPWGQRATADVTSTGRLPCRSVRVTAVGVRKSACSPAGRH